MGEWVRDGVVSEGKGKRDVVLRKREMGCGFEEKGKEM